jgi:hypothetical protein
MWAGGRGGDVEFASAMRFSTWTGLLGFYACTTTDLGLE